MARRADMASENQKQEFYTFSCNTRIYILAFAWVSKYFSLGGLGAKSIGPVAQHFLVAVAW